MSKSFSIFLVYFFLLGFSIFVNSCNKDSDSLSYSNSNNEDGLYLYLTDISSHPEFQYQEINVTKVEITGEPIISYSDIIFYDTTSHIITLKTPIDSLYIENDVHGTPFILTLDGEKIYGGWFWIAASSAICHWVVIEPDCPSDNLKDNEFRIKLGYPSEDYFQGVDPRNNQRIFKRLHQDGKVK